MIPIFKFFNVNPVFLLALRTGQQPDCSVHRLFPHRAGEVYLQRLRGGTALVRHAINRIAFLRRFLQTAGPHKIADCLIDFKIIGQAVLLQYLIDKLLGDGLFNALEQIADEHLNLIPLRSPPGSMPSSNASYSKSNGNTSP